MALTGHLSDLSLSELIEFFCNQRKTGSLKVLYPNGAGYFFLQTGSVVDAQIGVLRGIDAVYYALTLPNAKFEFSATSEPAERTINQPWTQVVLEGLRRLDEGVMAPEAFPAGYIPPLKETEADADPVSVTNSQNYHMPAFLSFMSSPSTSKRKTIRLGAVGVAVLACVAVIGVPAGWYRNNRIAVPQNESVAGSSSPQPVAAAVEQPAQSDIVSDVVKPSEEVDGGSKRRETDRRPREEKNAASSQPRLAASATASSTTSTKDAGRPGPKRVVVTVTYDESGRVTQASGGDAMALRIARQKRFPAGKGGSATVTIPLN